MKSSFACLACLSLYGLTGLAAQAATISFESIDQPFFYSFNLLGITATPGGSFSNASSSSTISATLDTTANTFSIDNVKVNFTNVGLQFTQTVIIGFGQSVPLQFDFEARPFSFQVIGGAPVAFTPGPDGSYTGGSFASAASVVFDPIVIDYKITNTLTGDVTTGTAAPEVFSQETMFATLNVLGPLQATGSPNQMTLDKLVINAGGPTPGTDTITAPISGGAVAFNISYGFFNIDSYKSAFEPYQKIVLTQVPEPTSGALFGLAAIGLAFRRRNRRP